MSDKKSSPIYNKGDILVANGEFAHVADNCVPMQINSVTVFGYLITFTNQYGENRVVKLTYDFVDQFFKLSKALNCELLTIDGWNKTKIISLRPGYVVKRWNKPNGPVLWAGYFNGDPKLASCDEWMPITIEEQK
jgi:hypothetical protein